jgi:beta-N-acetylhexosaminidase
MKQPDMKWVESTLASMTLEEKVGQILIVGFWDYTDKETILQRARKYHLGGVFHFNESYKDVAAFVEAIQQDARIPLFISSDYEAGTGFYLREGTSFPRPMSRGYAGTEESEYEIGKMIALEGKACGANYTFSPVVDVNIDPMCPDVNIRAYSDDTDAVCRLSRGYIRGIQDQGMIATAKHFPGNGGTFMDQHISTAIIDYSREDIERLFLKPFREAIAAGVGAIMVAHLEVPALTTEIHPKIGRTIPASMSYEVITELLKEQMGFDGIVMSDALDMGGVMGMYNREEANIKALQAGTDLLLNFFPMDFEKDYESILRNVKEGVISMERLDDAVRTILKAKSKIGLDQGNFKTLPQPELEKIFVPGAKDEICQDIALKGLTLLHNINNILPIADIKGKKVTVFSIFCPENKVIEGQGQFPLVEIASKRLAERGAIVNHIEVVSDWTFRELRSIYEGCKDSDYVFVNFFVVPSYAIGTLIPNINAVRLFYLGILSQAKNVVITSFGRSMGVHAFPNGLYISVYIRPNC